MHCVDLQAAMVSEAQEVGVKVCTTAPASFCDFIIVPSTVQERDHSESHVFHLV